MPMYSFAVNFAILDSTSMPVCSFAVNFAILDSTSMPVCSFAVNFDFLDFTFSVSTKESGCIDPATIYRV